MKTTPLLTIALALAVAGPAQADPRADVMSAFEKAMAQTSYRAQSTTDVGGQPQTSTIDVQTPDRFHMRGPGSEVIVLPAGSWMNQGGQWM